MAYRKEIVVRKHQYAEKRDNRWRDISLLSYFDQQIASKKNAGQHGTAAAYLSTRRSIAQYSNGNDVRCSGVTYLFVQGYHQFLLAKGISSNTISFYMRNFRTVYNLASQGGWIVYKENPFQHIKIKMHKTVKRALSVEDMQKIAKLDLQRTPTLDMARDIFMFSFYTRGMSFVDIVHLKVTDVVQGAIFYHRRKTNQLMQISLTKPLLELIHKYKNDSQYLFPVLDESSSVSLYRQYKIALIMVNRRLKKIAERVGLDIALTTYVARHSWATIAKEWGASIAVISEGLGHTSEKTTQIYLKEFDHSVLDHVNNEISNLLK